MFKHVLPECEIGQKGHEMALEIVGIQAYCVWVGTHFSIVGKLQYERHVLGRVQDGQQSDQD